MTDGPLKGIRILDLSRVLAGPWATQLLADLGAEVIKVERPGTGDDTRHWGPPFLPGADGQPSGHATYYFAANRGKKSLTIDLRVPEGCDLVRRLALRSDVLVENFKVDDLARIGLDYASLARLNPGLIYCSITGFGQTGPLRARPGYDLLMQGMGGLMSVTGEPDREPMRVGVALVDVMSGLYASSAILGALYERMRSGAGQHIDLALFDVQLATLANQATAFLATGREPTRAGNSHPSIAPYQLFETSDGSMIVGAGNETQFAALAKAIGEPALAQSEEFSTPARRTRNRDKLIPIIAARLKARTTRSWIEVLEQAGVPCGPVNGVKAAFEEPQAQARQVVRRVKNVDGFDVPLVANPIRYSRSHSQSDVVPPALGQHTEEILSQVLQLSGEEIARLRQVGAIGTEFSRRAR
jgi:crotonobetainyl-CoA:carnitine CoA-transferase CaiB-like acyl-CoA transferase